MSLELRVETNAKEVANDFTSLEHAIDDTSKSNEKASKSAKTNADATKELGQESKEASLKIKDVNSALGAFKNVLDGQLKALSEGTFSIKGMTSSLGNLAKANVGLLAVGAAVAGIKIGAGEALKVDTLTTELKGLTDSTAEASKAFTELRYSAAAGSEGFDAVANASKQLLQSGVEVDNLRGRLDSLATVARANNQDFSTLSTTFAKIQNNTKDSVGELAKLQKNGLPILDELGKLYGVSAEKALELAEAGQISKDDIVDAFDAMALSAEQAGKGLSTTAGDFANIWGGIVADLKSTLGNIFSPFIEVSKPFMNIIGIIANEIGQLTDIIRDLGVKIGESVANLRIFETIGNTIRATFDALKIVVKALADVAFDLVNAFLNIVEIFTGAFNDALGDRSDDMVDFNTILLKTGQVLGLIVSAIGVVIAAFADLTLAALASAKVTLAALDPRNFGKGYFKALEEEWADSTKNLGVATDRALESLSNSWDALLGKTEVIDRKRIESNKEYNIAVQEEAEKTKKEVIAKEEEVKKERAMTFKQWFKELEAQAKSEMEIVSLVYSSISSMLSSFSNIFSLSMKNDQKALDKRHKEELKAWDKYYKDKLNLDSNGQNKAMVQLEKDYEDGLVNLYEYQREKRRLEEEQATLEEQLAEEQLALEEQQKKEKNDLDKKQFDNDKKFNIAQTIMETARGALKAFTSFLGLPFGLGIPLGAAAAGTVTALGGVQTALIAKQEFVPAYASGTDFHGGGIALVGEQGAELIDLPRGTSVKTADETKKIMDSMGGSPTINITVNGAGMSNKELANMIATQVSNAFGRATKGGYSL